MVQAWGIGPVRSNTVLLDWLGDDGGERPASEALHYGLLLRSAIRLGQNVVVLHAERAEWERMAAQAGEERRIDVWWWGGDSSRLALLFAYLMTRTEPWSDARIQLLAPAAAGQEQKVEANLRHRIAELRIEAAVTALRDDPDELVARSRTATLVLQPLRLAGMRVSDGFGRPCDAVLPALPVTALVAAAGDVELGESEDAPEAAAAQAEA